MPSSLPVVALTLPVFFRLERFWSRGATLGPYCRRPLPEKCNPHAWLISTDRRHPMCCPFHLSIHDSLAMARDFCTRTMMPIICCCSGLSCWIRCSVTCKLCQGTTPKLPTSGWSIWCGEVTRNCAYLFPSNPKASEYTAFPMGQLNLERPAHACGCRGLLVWTSTLR